MIPAILYAALAGLGDLVGGFIVTTRARHSRRFLAVVTAFGAGFMLAVAFLEMIPDAYEAPGGVMTVLFGYLAVHLTQHTLTPHFHFGEETHAEATASRGIGVWALVGLLPHSFFDGVAIASGFGQSAALGVLVFGSVLIHKLPEGVSLASIMLASGNSERKSLLAVGSIALATVLGAAITPGFGPLATYGLGLAAGVTIYVAASNLIPESQHEEGWAVPGAVFLGVVAFYLIRMILPEHV